MVYFPAPAAAQQAYNCYYFKLLTIDLTLGRAVV